MSAATIDSATAQMANTTLTEPTSTAQGPSVGSGGDQPINAAQNEAVIQSAAEGRRLYIGNLAYATTEGELKDFFKDYLIESVSIPTNPRTTRPVGYAFVDVSTPSEGERAISELNGKLILDRKVSVQLARKPDEPAPEGDEFDEEGRRRGGGRGRGRARGRGRGRGRARGRGGRAGEAVISSETSTNGPVNVPGQVDALTETTNEALTAEPGTEGTISDKAPPKSRVPRQRGPPEDGVPSKTKIMVANLPYDLREDKLLEIFKDYSPSAAKLALRPIPRFMVRKLQQRNEPRKGRGFAFVTLASEEMQQKAIADMNGKEIEGRELAVKVAIDSPGKEDEALDAQADAETAKENGYPSTAEGSANTEATVAAS